jgi:hypothetical protein
MAEESARLEITGKKRPGNGEIESPAAEVTRLQSEIVDARDGLGVYLSELDRRRHEVLDMKLQLKKHRGVGIGVGVVAVAALAGVALAMTRSRRNAAQTGVWAPWRITPAEERRSSRLGKFLLGSVVPVALQAARVAVERGRMRRLPSP